MSKIKNKDTKAEVLVRKYLFSHGFRYRKNVSKLPGKPDIVLPKYKTVIFVNGCFWHKHANCNKFVVPKTRTEWWLNKINTNVERDIVNIEKLRDLGWKVFIIWECEAEKNLDEVVNKVIREMVDTLPSHE
jgi:DNA mismatch endonuclease (patch repair protein)